VLTKLGDERRVAEPELHRRRCSPFPLGSDSRLPGAERSEHGLPLVSCTAVTARLLPSSPDSTVSVERRALVELRQRSWLADRRGCFDDRHTGTAVAKFHDERDIFRPLAAHKLFHLAEVRPEKLAHASLRWHGRLELEALMMTLAESQLALVR
jgi:hypothetical protein